MLILGESRPNKRVRSLLPAVTELFPLGDSYA